MEGYQESHIKQRYGCYADLSLAFTIDKSFQRFSQSASSSWYKEGETLTHEDQCKRPLLRVTATQFQNFSCVCCFLKNIQSVQDNPYTKESQFGGGKFFAPLPTTMPSLLIRLDTFSFDSLWMGIGALSHSQQESILLTPRLAFVIIMGLWTKTENPDLYKM